MRIIALLISFMLAFNVKAQSDAAWLHTGLPVCYIQTEGAASIQRTEYSEATILMVADGDTVMEQTPMLIEGRGNYTWTVPKKPYKIKFQNAVQLLDLPEGKKFALLANYHDPGLIHAALGFTAGKFLDFEWVPSYAYVELVLNGEYMGNYQLVESIQARKNRIDIDKKTGFILEEIYPDRLDTERVHFFSSLEHKLYEFKDPDGEDVSEEQKAYAEDVFDELERNLSDADMEWKEYVDATSFVKWYYWVNVFNLDECNIYLVKYDNTAASKIKMGPVWDFDWGMGLTIAPPGVCSFHNIHNLRNMSYMSKLAWKQSFMEEVAQLHFSVRDMLLEHLLDYCDGLKDQLYASRELNQKRWVSYYEPPTFAAMTHDEIIERYKNWLVEHFSFLDGTLADYQDGLSGIASQDDADCQLWTLSGFRTDKVQGKTIYIRTDRTGRNAQKVLN